MRPRLPSPRLLVLVLLFSFSAAAAASTNRVAVDANGNPVHVDGSIVLIEPDIELSEVLAGGVEEPRKEWSERARRLYPEEVHKRLQDGGVDADADIGIASFDLLQGRAGRERTRCHDRHRQSPSTTGVVDIRA